MIRDIGVAVAAFGSASRVFHVPLIQSVPGLALRTIVSRHPEAVQAALPQVRAVRQFAAVCADPEIDLIVIPTPNDTHAPLAAQALEAGKHVVVDKPFALTRGGGPSAAGPGAGQRPGAVGVPEPALGRRFPHPAAGAGIRCRRRAGASSNRTSTASGRRCRTAGATAPDLAPGSGTISARI